MSKTPTGDAKLGRMFSAAIPDLPPDARNDRRLSLLAILTRRATEWGWRRVYERIRAGEKVSPFYERMTELTKERRAGKRKPAPTDEYLWEENHE